MRQCSRCKLVCEDYERENYFHRDSTKKDGFNYHCKSCVRQYASKRRKKNKEENRIRYLKDRNKNLVRDESKRLYPGPHQCSLISCVLIAELHHLDYDGPHHVIPLCRNHHGLIHTGI